MGQGVLVKERPPGWYPDASAPGYQRWWDGGTWSHVTRPVPGLPEYPAAPSLSPVPQVAPATPDGVPLAGPIRRLAARAIDSLLIGLLSLAVGYPYAQDLFTVMGDYLDRAQRAVAVGGPQPDLLAMLSDERYVAASAGVAVVQFVLGAVYHITLIALRGATLGKLMTGVRVRLWVAERRPTWREAALRWAGRDLPTVLALADVLPFVSLVYTLTDSLWLLRDQRRQCLHDKPAGTVVVRSARRPDRGSR
jgi:uncharacterized RDD family membrane protein YckC